MVTGTASSRKFLFLWLAACVIGLVAAKPALADIVAAGSLQVQRLTERYAKVSFTLSESARPRLLKAFVTATGPQGGLRLLPRTFAQIRPSTPPFVERYVRSANRRHRFIEGESYTFTLSIRGAGRNPINEIYAVTMGGTSTPPPPPSGPPSNPPPSQAPAPSISIVAVTPGSVTLSVAAIGTFPQTYTLGAGLSRNGSPEAQVWGTPGLSQYVPNFTNLQPGSYAACGLVMDAFGYVTRSARMVFDVPSPPPVDWPQHSIPPYTAMSLDNWFSRKLGLVRGAVPPLPDSAVTRIVEINPRTQAEAPYEVYAAVDAYLGYGQGSERGSLGAVLLSESVEGGVPTRKYEVYFHMDNLRRAIVWLQPDGRGGWLYSVREMRTLHPAGTMDIGQQYVAVGLAKAHGRGVSDFVLGPARYVSSPGGRALVDCVWRYAQDTLAADYWRSCRLELPTNEIFNPQHFWIKLSDQICELSTEESPGPEPHLAPVQGAVAGLPLISELPVGGIQAIQNAVGPGYMYVWASHFLGADVADLVDRTQSIRRWDVDGYAHRPPNQASPTAWNLRSCTLLETVVMAKLNHTVVFRGLSITNNRAPTSGAPAPMLEAAIVNTGGHVLPRGNPNYSGFSRAFIQYGTYALLTPLGSLPEVWTVAYQDWSPRGTVWRQALVTFGAGSSGAPEWIYYATDVTHYGATNPTPATSPSEFYWDFYTEVNRIAPRANMVYQPWVVATNPGTLRVTSAVKHIWPVDAKGKLYYQVNNGPWQSVGGRPIDTMMGVMQVVLTNLPSGAVVNCKWELTDSAGNQATDRYGRIVQSSVSSGNVVS